MLVAKPIDITGEIAAILRKATKGTVPCVMASRGRPGFLTAYEILALLDDGLRKRLIEEYGDSGRSGAAAFVAKSARQVSNVTVETIDAQGLTFTVGEAVEAGVEKCSIFCLKLADDFD